MYTVYICTYVYMSSMIPHIYYIFHLFSSNTNNKTTSFGKKKEQPVVVIPLPIKTKKQELHGHPPWSPPQKSYFQPTSHFTMPLTCWTPWTSLGRPQLVSEASNASTAKLSAKELLHAASSGAGRAIAIKVSPFLKHLKNLDWLFVRESEKRKRVRMQKIGIIDDWNVVPVRLPLLMPTILHENCEAFLDE